MSSISKVSEIKGIPVYEDRNIKDVNAIICKELNEETIEKIIKTLEIKFK